MKCSILESGSIDCRQREKAQMKEKVVLFLSLIVNGYKNSIKLKKNNYINIQS